LALYKPNRLALYMSFERLADCLLQTDKNLLLNK